MFVEIKMYCSPLCPFPHEVRESMAIIREMEREIRVCVIANLLQMREERKGSETHSNAESELKGNLDFKHRLDTAWYGFRWKATETRIVPGVATSILCTSSRSQTTAGRGR